MFLNIAPVWRKRLMRFWGKEPGAPQSDIKKPGTSNDPLPSDKLKTTSHAQSNQQNEKGLLTTEAPTNPQKETLLTKENAPQATETPSKRKGKFLSKPMLRQKGKISSLYNWANAKRHHQVMPSNGC